jgi:hypothetical protein
VPDAYKRACRSTSSRSPIKKSSRDVR